MKEKVALVHALSGENLVLSELIGGIPNPSLAFIKTSRIFAGSGYGEIVLIKDPESVNLKKHYCSSSDIYSAISPVVTFDINKKLLDTIQDNISKKLKNIEFESVIHYLDGGGDSRLARGALTAEIYLREHLGIKLLYILNKYPEFTIENYLEEPEDFMGFIGCDNLEYIQILVDNYGMENEVSDYLLNLISEKTSADFPIDDLSSNRRKAVRTRIFKNNVFNVFEDTMNISFKDSLDKKLKTISEIKKEINIDALKLDLDTIIRGDTVKFEDYITELSSKLIGQPYFYKKIEKSLDETADDLSIFGVEKAKANIDDLSAEMNNDLIIVDDQISTGIMKLAASVRSRIESLEDLEGTLDLLTSGGDDSRVDSIDLIDEKINLAINMIESFVIYPNADYQKATFIESLVKDNCVPGDNLAMFLHMDMVDDKFLALVEEIKEDCLNFKVDYFEVKLSNPLGISDFDYAVVPKDTDPQTIDVLLRNNVQCLFYSLSCDKSYHKAFSKANDNFIFDCGNFKVTDTHELDICAI